jgi:hypothetical protein
MLLKTLIVGMLIIGIVTVIVCLVVAFMGFIDALKARYK